MPIMTGGITEEDKPATSEVQALVQQVQDQITGKMNSATEKFEAISYRTQVVAGRNYFVKVDTSFFMYHHQMHSNFLLYFADSCWQ